MNRAERRRRTATIQRARLRWLRILDIPETPGRVGRCRRHNPADCGKPRCVTCHHDKLYNKPRRDEEAA